MLEFRPMHACLKPKPDWDRNPSTSAVDRAVTQRAVVSVSQILNPQAHGDFGNEIKDQSDVASLLSSGAISLL